MPGTLIDPLSNTKLVSLTWIIMGFNQVKNVVNCKKHLHIIKTDINDHIYKNAHSAVSQ